MKPQRRIEIGPQQLAQLLERLESRKLEPQDYELLEAILESWQYVCSSLEKKNVSVKRLKRLLFGSSSEKTDCMKALRPGCGNRV
jgi:hypothetical protein